MSDEQREKGVEERRINNEPSEAGRSYAHNEEPEVEGHVMRAGHTEKKADLVEKKSA